MSADDGSRDEVDGPVESVATGEVGGSRFVEVGESGVDLAGFEVVDEEVDEQLASLLVSR